MASVTIANLTDLGRGIPAAGSAGASRFITAQGPLKIEYNFFFVATADDFTNDDTFTSRLAHPWAVTVQSISEDLTGTAFVGSVTLDKTESSSTYKTITLRDITTATTGILVTVYGY